MLICGAPKESYNPVMFKSVLHPFPVYAWLIILIVAGLMSVCLAVRRTGSGAYGSSEIITLTPLVNPISDPGSPSGRFRYSFCVLSSVFLSHWYLGLLESEKMPIVKVIEGSFRNF